MKGPVTLSIQGKVEGVEAVFDRLVVPAGEKATLTVKAETARRAARSPYRFLH